MLGGGCAFIVHRIRNDTSRWGSKPSLIGTLAHLGTIGVWGPRE